MLAGRVPLVIRPLLFGGASTAIIKEGGGLRPIAVGYTWLPLASKVVSRRVADRAAALLAPRQVGFGVSGGAEAAVDASRRYFSNLPALHVFVKVDFTNAFYAMRRDVLLEAISHSLPELLPYALTAYSANSLLSQY